MIEKIFFWGLATMAMGIFYLEPNPLSPLLAGGFIFIECTLKEPNK